MTTAVSIVDKKTLSDGALAITFRANADAASDSVATLYITPAMTAADIQTWVTGEKARVAAQYDALQAAHATIATIS